MKWIKVTVICFILCELKCSGMSLNEVEDFKNFIEKTSHLDQILVKKGSIPEHDVDDEDSISDDAWEQSGKFEGDLILNERQRRTIVENVAEGLSRNGLKDITKRWPDNELVYYIQKEHFSGDQVQAIMDGIDDLAQASCIKFRPYRKGDKDAVVIQGSRRGCFSNVGYQGGYQVLNLNGRHPPGRGCFRHGTIVHELLHTLGFYHMQSSPDRDDYIEVKWENIHEPARHNFRKYNSFSVSDFGVGYDYDSVLHYGRRAFSRNGQDTLVPKQGGASIGQRVRLSDKDVQKLNKMYCDADSDHKNNADDVQNPAEKPTKKKDKPKNKPFQGHGIGYHQGKTIVIKLPAAETIKLTNSPNYYLFDHFSKTPEAVPQTFTEGIGVGKQVTYKYDPVSYNMQDYSTKADTGGNDETDDGNNTLRYSYSAQIPVAQNHDKTIEKEVKQDSDSKLVSGLLKPEDIENSAKTSSSDNSNDVSKETEQDYSGNSRDIVDEAFERLGKIIQTHVYPSQTPDLEVYKTKLDYSQYYNPENKFQSEPESVQVDKHFGATKITNTEKSSDDPSNDVKEKIITPVLTVAEYEKGQHDSDETQKPPYNDHLPRGFDTSFGISSLNRMPRIKEEKFVTPEYATHKYLANRHDYSSLYRPKDEQQDPKPTLYGYLLTPNHDKFVENIKKDNEKYNLDSYSYSPDNGYKDISAKLIQYDQNESKKSVFGRTPSGKKAYSLFGVLVPLTQKWYKVDYDPHSGSYSIETPESSEDYR